MILCNRIYSGDFDWSGTTYHGTRSLTGDTVPPPPNGRNGPYTDIDGWGRPKPGLLP